MWARALAEKLLNRAVAEGERGTRVWPGWCGAPGSFDVSLRLVSPLSCLGRGLVSAVTSQQRGEGFPSSSPLAFGRGTDRPPPPPHRSQQAWVHRVLAQPSLWSLGFRTTGHSPSEEQENSFHF